MKKLFIILLLGLLIFGKGQLLAIALPLRLPPISCSYLPFQNTAVTMIIGSIADGDGYAMHGRHGLKDYQLRYSGYSCRTDQNGIFYFRCKDQLLSDPIFILISNGNYWVTRTDVISSKSFLRPVIKQDSQKKYLFFKSRIENDKIFFDKTSLELYSFELPSERTLILNINSDYVEDSIEPTKNFLFNQSCIMLPSIKLKSLGVIRELKKMHWKTKGKTPCFSRKRYMQRIKDKSWLRKCKHVPSHEEIEIRQTIRKTKPNSREAYVMISIPSKG